MSCSPADAEITPPSTPHKSWRSRWYRPGVLLILAAGMAAYYCGPRLPGWLPDLTQRPEYRFSAARIRTSPGGEYIPRDLVEQALSQADLADDFSILDPDLGRQIAEAFALHPWVRRVVAVRKETPAGLYVELDYRAPVVMIEVRQGMYPVDGEGVLLPPSDFAASDARRFPILSGVHSTPQGPAGSSWGDARVEGGARLAAALGPHWKVLHLASIVCPRDLGSPELLDAGSYTLVTTGGSRIHWGRAPGADHPGELTPEKKIGRLKKYVADYGSFDRPHGPYEIDIRHWQEISRRPLAVGLAPRPASRVR